MNFQLATIGIEINPNKYRLSDGSIIECSILDTNGTERYRALNENYFRQADGCIIVYDITNQRSFDEIKEYYIPKLRDKCKENITTILLGNKKDKENERKISIEQGNQLAFENNFLFKETCCSERTNVSDAFQTIIEKTNLQLKIKQTIDSNKSITISRKNHNNSRIRRNCC